MRDVGLGCGNHLCRAGVGRRVAHRRLFMSHELIEELMLFTGLMATLGCVTKIILAIINRRRAATAATVPALEEIAQRLGRMEQALDATAVEVERISE